MPSSHNTSRLSVGFGFIAILAGVACMLLPVLATAATCYVVGSAAIVTGALRLRSRLSIREWPNSRELATALLLLVAGLAFLLAPIATAVFAAIALGVTTAWNGARTAATAWRFRDDPRALWEGVRGFAMTLIGATAVVLAEGAPFAIGQVSGVLLLFIGTLLVLRGLAHSPASGEAAVATS